MERWWPTTGLVITGARVYNSSHTRGVTLRAEGAIAKPCPPSHHAEHDADGG
jgi:hypothetical protein